MPVSEVFKVRPGGFTSLADGTAAVRAALAQLRRNLAAHLAEATGAHAASAVSFTPAGTIAATTVQAAIAELDSESDARLDLIEVIHSTVFTLTDDQAAYMEFTGGSNVLGGAIVSANTSAGGSAVVAFRAGDASAFVAVVGSAGATVTGVATTLAGTTGTDGHLTIGCPTGSARIYIENRTGATRSYSVAFPTLRSRTPASAWTTV